VAFLSLSIRLPTPCTLGRFTLFPFDIQGEYAYENRLGGIRRGQESLKERGRRQEDEPLGELVGQRTKKP